MPDDLVHQVQIQAGDYDRKNHASVYGIARRQYQDQRILDRKSETRKNIAFTRSFIIANMGKERQFKDLLPIFLYFSLWRKLAAGVVYSTNTLPSSLPSTSHPSRSTGAMRSGHRFGTPQANSIRRDGRSSRHPILFPIWFRYDGKFQNFKNV